MYTMNDIASLAKISRVAVLKRLKAVKPVDSIWNGGGRPVNYYDDSVFELFPQLRFALPEVIKNEPSRIIEMKKDNPCKNKSRVLSEKLTTKLIKATYSNYMEQGDRLGIKRVCEDLIADYWWEIEKDLAENNKTLNAKGEIRDLEFMQNYWYFKVIKRSDKINAGVAIRENWELQWREKHDYNKANARKATTKYSMLEILENAGMIGEGFGAGALWVIDGTVF